MKHFLLGLCLISVLPFCHVQADEHDSEKPKEHSVGDSLVKGAGNWFKDVSDKREEFSEEAKEKLESGIGVMKGFAGGISERFGKAKEKLEESGEKIKEAVGDAALNAKDEFETAASKVSKYAKEASESMMSMFG